MKKSVKLLARTPKPTVTEVVAPRSVFIKVSPVPTTFAERRAALHAIKKHAPIEVFKKITHTAASFISIVETEDKALKLIESSPLTYEVSKPIPSTPIAPQVTVMPSTPDHITDRHTRAGLPLPTSAPVPSDEDKRQFVVHIFPLQEYNHMEHIERSRFYGTWQINRHRNQSIINTLMKNIPVNIRQEGLATWDGLEDGLLEPLDRTVKDIWLQRVKARNDIYELPELAQGLRLLQEKVLAERQRQIIDRIPGISFEDMQSLMDADEPVEDEKSAEKWLDVHDKETPDHLKVKPVIGEDGKLLNTKRTVESVMKRVLKSHKKVNSQGASPSEIESLGTSESDFEATKVGSQAIPNVVSDNAISEELESPTFENSIFLVKVMEETHRREAFEKLEADSIKEQLEAVERAKEDQQ